MIAFASSNAFSVTAVVAGAIAIAVAVAGLLVSAYVGWQLFKENEKFELLRLIGVTLASFGGTSFSGSDLITATFRQAKLKSTNFANSRKNNTCLTHVCWQGAQQLNRARVGNAILQDRNVRRLLTTPE